MKTKYRYILVGRNLYTEDKCAVGHIYGIYDTIEQAREAMEQDIRKSVEDLCWSDEDIHKEPDNPYIVYAGDEYVWELKLVEEDLT